MTTPRSQLRTTKVAGTLRVPSARKSGCLRGPLRHTECASYKGFTLVELLVVITIIGMLMALLIPAVGAVRARARQTQCANNIRQLGTAVLNFGSSKDRFPGYVEPVEQANGSFAHITSTSGGMADAYFISVAPNAQDARAGSRISWAAHILPGVDRQDLWDNLTNVTDNNDPRRKVVPMDVYTCPADSELTSLPDNAGLSYVANTGAWDWVRSRYLTPPGKGDTVDNGLFHNRVDSNLTSRLGANIRDGAATTLMLGENIHKNQQYCWMGVGPKQFGELQFGMVWVVNTTPNGESKDYYNQARMGVETVGVDPTDPADEIYPYYARPASNHPGGVINVVFADGHTDSLSPEIDYLVYQQLMTPRGGECVDPQDHSANLDQNEPIRIFRTAAPLSEKDF